MSKKSNRTQANSGEVGDPISTHISAKLRDFRKQKGWSLEQLASASGVSRSMLSQVERNLANPTVAVIFKIARAFGVSITEFVQDHSNTSNIQVIRANDDSHIFRSDELCSIRTLSPLGLEKDVELYEVKLKPSGFLRSSAHFPGTREFLTVEQGRVLLESASESVEIQKGDSASYRADVTHAITNTGKGEALVILVVIYR